MIYQNDQYYFQIRVKQAGDYISPAECEEMIIKVGNVVKKKSLNELLFYRDNMSWLFPLEYSQSSDVLKFTGNIQVQAWFRTADGNFYDTNVANLKINQSIINKKDLGELQYGNKQP